MTAPRHPHDAPPRTGIPQLRRQGRDYLVVGALQWLLDWGVFVALTHLGVPVAPANVTGRITGALLGYWVNGKWTFASDHTAVGATQFRRFMTMWIATTLLSTWAVSQLDDLIALRWIWLAKPAIEVALGLIGFVLSRCWIYKR